MRAQVIPAKGKPKASRPARKAVPSAERGRRVGEILTRLRERLALNDKELGRMLGTGETTVRRWAQGVDLAPLAFVASLTPHSASLARLEEIFVPDRLAEVIRRPAPLFDGRSALDWILEGRFPEVVDRYEIAFRYQA